MPGIESDWPDNYTLVQNLAIVPGSPDEVAILAQSIIDDDLIAPPQLIPD